MKKSIILSALTGLAIGASVVWAQTVVSSANILGYVTVDIPRGGMVMLRNDFISSGTTTSEIFGDTLPVGTQVSVWNPSKTPPGYDLDVYQSIRGTRSWSQNLSLARGKGFWVKIPSTAAEPSYSVTFLGEVPSEANAVMPVAEGLNMVAYAFPVNVLWTNTTLAKNAAVGDEVSVWDPVAKAYAISQLQSIRGKISWSKPNLSIPIGRSVWYKTTKPREWTEPKPY